MAAKIVDASALAAVLFNEPAADQVVAQLLDATLLAPPLIEYEIGNTCWKKCRRHPELEEPLRIAFLSLRKLELQLHDVDAARVLKLANELRITYYDASYLWLARQLDAPLISLDHALLSLHG
ncbi:MAG: type II toxin-antitoxin system VapC family toxin [Steroidobacterales bacterium]